MNWGLKIICGLGLFMLFIIGTVVYMVGKDTDSLEENDYYERSLNYDEVYSSKQNLIEDNMKPTLLVKSDTLTVHFKHNQNKGIIHFKRPSDGKLDVNSSFETATQVFKMPISAFKRGNWHIELVWENSGKSYIFEQPLFL